MAASRLRIGVPTRDLPMAVIMRPSATPEPEDGRHLGLRARRLRILVISAALGPDAVPSRGLGTPQLPPGGASQRLPSKPGTDRGEAVAGRAGPNRPAGLAELAVMAQLAPSTAAASRIIKASKRDRLADPTLRLDDGLRGPVMLDGQESRRPR